MASTTAQVESAIAQENGVGKAQAGKHAQQLHMFARPVMMLTSSMRIAHTTEVGAPSLRTGRVKRETKETKVDVTISIDGTGRCKAKTPIHFLNHMLEVRHNLSV